MKKKKEDALLFSKRPDFWSACREGNEAMVRRVIDQQRNLIHEPDYREGRSPLFLASRSGHASIVKLLLEAGARDRDGTALTTSKNTHVRELLRQYDTRNVHYACQHASSVSSSQIAALEYLNRTSIQLLVEWEDAAQEKQETTQESKIDSRSGGGMKSKTRKYGSEELREAARKNSLFEKMLKAKRRNPYVRVNDKTEKTCVNEEVECDWQSEKNVLVLRSSDEGIQGSKTKQLFRSVVEFWRKPDVSGVRNGTNHRVDSLVTNEETECPWDESVEKKESNEASLGENDNCAALRSKIPHSNQSYREKIALTGAEFDEKSSGDLTIRTKNSEVDVMCRQAKSPKTEDALSCKPSDKQHNDIVNEDGQVMLYYSHQKRQNQKCSSRSVPSFDSNDIVQQSPGNDDTVKSTDSTVVIDYYLPSTTKKQAGRAQKSMRREFLSKIRQIKLIGKKTGVSKGKQVIRPSLVKYGELSTGTISTTEDVEDFCEVTPTEKLGSKQKSNQGNKASKRVTFSLEVESFHWDELTECSDDISELEDNECDWSETDSNLDDDSLMEMPLTMSDMVREGPEVLREAMSAYFFTDSYISRNLF